MEPELIMRKSTGTWFRLRWKWPYSARHFLSSRWSLWWPITSSADFAILLKESVLGTLGSPKHTWGSNAMRFEQHNGFYYWLSHDSVGIRTDPCFQFFGWPLLSKSQYCSRNFLYLNLALGRKTSQHHVNLWTSVWSRPRHVLLHAFWTLWTPNLQIVSCAESLRLRLHSFPTLVLSTALPRVCDLIRVALQSHYVKKNHSFQFVVALSDLRGGARCAFGPLLFVNVVYGGHVFEFRNSRLDVFGCFNWLLSICSCFVLHRLELLLVNVDLVLEAGHGPAYQALNTLTLQHFLGACHDAHAPPLVELLVWQHRFGLARLRTSDCTPRLSTPLTLSVPNLPWHLALEPLRSPRHSFCAPWTDNRQGDRDSRLRVVVIIQAPLDVPLLLVRVVSSSETSSVGLFIISLLLFWSFVGFPPDCLYRCPLWACSSGHRAPRVGSTASLQCESTSSTPTIIGLIPRVCLFSTSS